MHRNRHAALEAAGEVVAFHHAGDGVARGQLDQAAGAERIAPFGVVADFGAVGVQHQAGLGVVGLGVFADLLGRERRAGGVAAAGIADLGGEVADQEDHRMAEILQLAHLVQHHRVAQVNVGRGGIQAELDAQGRAGGAAAGQLGGEFGDDEQFVATPLGHAQIFGDPGVDGVGGGRHDIRFYQKKMKNRSKKQQVCASITCHRSFCTTHSTPVRAAGISC